MYLSVDICERPSSVNAESEVSGCLRGGRSTSHVRNVRFRVRCHLLVVKQVRCGGNTRQYRSLSLFMNADYNFQWPDVELLACV